MTASRRLPSSAGWILLALPAVIYAAVLARLAVNFPVRDDYLGAIDFLIRWRHATSGSMGLVFEQYFSHRIPLTRLLILADQMAMGDLDLRLLCAFAWLGWALFAATLLRERIRAGVGALLLLPVPLILMQPQGSSNILVAVGSPGHAWCILLAYWSLLLAGRPSTAAAFGGSALGAAAALCTANGLLVFPAAILGCTLGRRWRPASVWCGVGAAIGIAYVANYSTAMQPVARAEFHLRPLLTNSLVMMGAPSTFGRLGLGPIAAIGALAAGAAAAAVLGDSLVRKRLTAESGLLVFLLLSVLMVAWARIGWPGEYMLQDRYRFYPLAIAAVLYAAVLESTRESLRAPVAAGTTAAAALFCFLSYSQNWAGLVNDRRLAESAAMNLQVGRATPVVLDADASRAREALTTAVADGILQPPRPLRPGDLAQIEGWASAPGASPVVSTAPSVFGRLVRPALAAGTRLEFGLMVIDGKVQFLPVVLYRATIAQALARGRFLADDCDLLIPENQDPHRSAIILAVIRNPGGQLSILWTARIEA